METLTVTAIFIILATVLFATVLISNRSFFSTEASVHVQEEARRAFHTMVGEIRQGKILLVSAPELEFQLNLGYNLAAPCPTADVCWGVVDQGGVQRPGWRVRYKRRLPSNELVREVLDSSLPPQVKESRILANHVSLLQFTQPSLKLVKVDLQVQQQSPQLPGAALAASPAALTTQLRLRNP